MTEDAGEVVVATLVASSGQDRIADLFSRADALRQVGKPVAVRFVPPRHVAARDEYSRAYWTQPMIELVALKDAV
jgi:hypothetical protein